MKISQKFAIPSHTLLGILLMLSACDSEMETDADGVREANVGQFDRHTHIEGNFDASAGGEFVDVIELAPGVDLGMHTDGREEYHVSSESGARALLGLVEAGDVEMDLAANSRLREFVDEMPRSQEHCPTKAATTNVSRISDLFSSANFAAEATKNAVGFGPLRPSSGEALVCVGADCVSSTDHGPPVEASVTRKVYFPHPPVYASAKVVDGFSGCIQSITIKYWGPMP